MDLPDSVYEKGARHLRAATLALLIIAGWFAAVGLVGCYILLVAKWPEYTLGISAFLFYFLLIWHGIYTQENTNGPS